MALTVNYTIRETLQETDGAGLYRATRDGDLHPVLLKAPLGDHPEPRDLDRFRHECQIAAALVSPALLKVEAWDASPDHPLLVLEDFGGVSLDTCLGEPWTPGRFLPVAIRMAAALAELHALGVTHRGLTPRSFIVKPETAELKLLGFGLASRVPREQPAATDSPLLEWTLPYLSPEQTGRMNRLIDPRSDLYAIGVVFYQMLTGTLPFSAGDPLEWVHAHVARAPEPPRERAAGVPGPLSDIVTKLLAKMADDRYQSAAGLQADLQTCLAEWQAAGRIEPFTLGMRDVSEQLVLPQRLYGRENEVAALVRAFERVSATGTPSTVLISGYSGIGKTTLVQELYRPTVRARGYFISGKFDQYKRGIPYGIISQAFGSLMRQLLGESDERIATWRSRFQAALGINAQLIVDVVPQLALIIGPQPPVPAIGLMETESRLHMVFRQFLGAIARSEHPLALFLDDLQWVDAASLKLIEHLITHADTHHLLVIGAYRDKEVDAGHPLARTLGELGSSGAIVERLALGPLSFEDQRQLIADSTRAEPERVASLARLVSEKTDGNPFFVIQFLLALAQDGLIAFDPAAMSWRWDQKAIEARGFSDNVVDLMVTRIERLPAEAQAALKLAAAFGDRFDVPTLAAVSGRPGEETHATLGAAVQEGLLLRQEDTYAFLHDRIQQAAYTFLPEGDRAGVHLRIGRAILAATPRENVPERVFDIVDQLNRGVALLGAGAEHEQERDRLAELNLLAARKARASVAFPSAVGYASAGLVLLPEDAWRTHYPLAFALSLERASSEFMMGSFDEALADLAELRVRAANWIDRAAAAVVEVNLHTNQVRGDKAIDVAIACLRDFGVSLVPHPTQDEIQRAYDEVQRNLGERRVEDLIDLPRMTDPDMRSAMDLLTALFAPAFQNDLRLLCLACCTAANLSMRHGNTDASCIAYVYLGVILGPLFGHHRYATEFGHLGYDLVERRGLVSNKALVLNGFEGIIRPWTSPIRDTIPGIERAIQASAETGELTFGCYSRHHLVVARSIAGDPLDDVLRASESALAFIHRTKVGFVDAVLTGHHQFVQALRGATASFGSLDGPGFSEVDFEERLAAGAATMSLPTCLYFIWKTQARFFAGDLDGAVAAAIRGQDLLWMMPSFQELAEHHYYAALALAARYPVATAAEQAGYLETMRVYQSRFRTWTESCPKNYAGKHLLISAEIARLSGGVEEAVGLYEEAIHAAHASGFVQCEAVGWELASRFYRQRRFEVIADAYLREARACYVSWGAEGKVRQLDRLYPGLRGRADAGAGARPEQLDAISVAKASQAISREVMLPELLKTMLRLIVEQTGAQQGWFLTVREGRMWLAAATDGGSNEVSLEPSGPANGELALPLSILNYVRRTGETVSLDDAAVHGSYVDDPYVAKRRPKSVLCLPIVLQSKPVGLVYLENNLTTHAFSADRLLVLQLLAGQAAISLENARLYADVREQQAATRASQAQLQAIVDSSAAVIFLKDTKGRYLLVNRRYEEIFALTREFVVGKTDYDVLPRDVAETVRANDNKVLAAGKVIEWEELIPHGGSVHTYLALKFPLRDAAGSIYGVCGISTDITARKHGEDALKQAVRMRDEFLSVASHELRTPLTTLMLSLDAIRRGATGPQLDRWMASAWQGGERLQRLFEELLDISRLEVGQMSLNRTNVDLPELVRRVVARFEPAIAGAQCTVHVEATALWGCWDRSRVDQVIANLLANALKFGGDRVEISVRAKGEHAVLSVRDYGIGIELAQQQAIFERFQRAVSERHYGGLGLGLYICRRIVEAHGGSIGVDSQPGAGATFTVELPLAERGATSGHG